MKYQYKHFKNIEKLGPFSSLLFYLQTFYTAIFHVSICFLVFLLENNVVLSLA